MFGRGRKPRHLNSMWNTAIVTAITGMNRMRTILDLLHKCSGSEFMVIKSGNEVEAQAEPLAAITVTFTEDAKHLEPPDDVFGCDALTG